MSLSSQRILSLTAYDAVRAFGCAYARVALGAALAVLLLTCSTPIWAQHSAQGFVPGRVLVQQKAGVSDDDLDSELAAQGARSQGKLRNLNVRVVSVPPGMSEKDMVERLRANSKIKFAELDEAVAPSATTNDPLLGNEWHLSKIGAGAAWDASTGAGTIIAILDTGVDGSHPDLVSRMVPGWNFYDNSADTSDPHGHGTAVAGTAAASGNNSVGVASVAWGSRIMPIRISDPTGVGYWSAMAQGLTWAADNGARVANISYAVAVSSTVQTAAQYMRSKGGVVVVAAGNNAIPETTPASDTMIVVSATNTSDALTSWSSYGSAVDIAAPGENVLTTMRGGSYGYWWGTSFASPVVAGVAALVKSARPDFTAAQLESVLFSTAVDLGSAGKDSVYGWGRVNAAGAVATAGSVTTDGTPPSVAIASPSSGSTVGGVVSVGVNASDNVGVVRVDLFVNGQLLGSDTTAPYSFAWDSTKMAEGAATMTAVAVDAKGNTGTSSAINVTVANTVAKLPADTTPPTVAIVSPANGSSINGTFLSISASASDAGGLGLVTLTIDGKTVASGNAGTLAYKWNTRKVSNGNHVIGVTATDLAGNKASTSITVIR